jgi:hypothetical protein
MLTLRKKIEHLFGDLTIHLTDLEVVPTIMTPQMVDEVMVNLEVDEVMVNLEVDNGKSYLD